MLEIIHNNYVIFYFVINEEIIKKAADAGLPSLKELFEKLPKEEALKGLGLLAIAFVSWTTIIEIRKIVLAK